MYNRKPKSMNVVGWITIIGGILLSFILGSNGYSWDIVIIVFIGSIINGLLLIGFSEVINLLQINTDGIGKLVDAQQILSMNDDEKTFITSFEEKLAEQGMKERLHFSVLSDKTINYDNGNPVIFENRCGIKKL